LDPTGLPRRFFRGFLAISNSFLKNHRKPFGKAIFLYFGVVPDAIFFFKIANST